jgi:arylsulfatase A-like enzyme
LKGILVLTLVVASALILSGCEQPQETAELPASTKRPNILLIVADDMGYSDIGAFGGEISTPALDMLASEGLRLANFHVLPSCSPTRSVLLSGMDNHQAGVGTMGELRTPEMDGYPGYAGYLNFEVAALPEVLQAGGYHTYMAGKWHLGDDQETTPFARGFEETFALLPGGGSHWNDRRPLSPPQTMNYSRNGQRVDSLPDNFYSTRYYTDILLEFLEGNRGDGKPFLAYLSYTAPHDPLHAPQEYIDKYKGTYDSGWDELRQQRLLALKDLGIIQADIEPLPRLASINAGWGELRRQRLQALKDRGIIRDDIEAFPRLASVKAWSDMAVDERLIAARDMEVYAAMVDYMDEQILRVIDYLKDIGEYENTMILFMSDNGANGAMPTAYPGQTQEYLDSFNNSLENRGLIDSYIETGPGWAQASMSPSRMFKGFTSEGGIRVPLIAKLPGTMSNAGTIGNSFVHVRDIMPTILDITAVPHTAEFDGRTVRPMQGQSLLDFFAGDADSPYPGAGQVGYELFGLKAFFDDEWKILQMPHPFASGEWELYNLKKDPGETNDLSSEYPQKTQEMVAMWEQYKEDNTILDIYFDLAGAIESDADHD